MGNSCDGCEQLKAAHSRLIALNAGIDIENTGLKARVAELEEALSNRHVECQVNYCRICCDEVDGIVRGEKQAGAAAERAAIVAWCRSLTVDNSEVHVFMGCIERGDHLPAATEGSDE